jgi:beta-glucosidase
MTAEEKFWQAFMLAGEFNGDPARFHDGLFGLQLSTRSDSATMTAQVNAIQKHFVERTRLGIPVIIFAEALHGLVADGATVFPQAIGLAATFDTSLMHDVAGAIAEECRGQGVRQVLSPVINIAADVRWGRTEETYGEDPCLTAEMGVAFVSEFERRGVIATPKHFIANVGDGGRDSYPIGISERLLREIYLPPFEACLHRGGARSVMTAYNSYDGAPCSASERLNRDVLKRELGFRGFVISDACAVGGANVLHLTASDYADAGAQAIMSGLDVIFQTSIDHHRLFSPPFTDGRLSSAQLDSAVARILRAKFELGLFEHPYVESAAGACAHGESHEQLARRAASESLVLLKNAGYALPLMGAIRSLAVIGPDADTVRLGGYSGSVTHPVSILDGIRARAGSAVEVRYAKGCERNVTDFEPVPAASLSLTGEYFDNIGMTGRPVLVRHDAAVDFDWTLFSPDPKILRNDNYAVRWTGQLTPPVSGRFKLGIDGNDGYRLYWNDSLIIDNWRKVSAGRTLAEVDLVANRADRLRLEYYEPAGNARLKLVWNVNRPSSEESSLRQAVDLAGSSDAAVLVLGIEEGEFRDRAHLALPGHQEELIHRIAALGKPTIVVLTGGSAITMADWLPEVSAVLLTWYGGMEGGAAVAAALFGDDNPAGRLPVTFPITEGQLPLVYHHKPTGRGDDYADCSGQGLFPFGYGLSYTDFEYSGLILEPPVLQPGQTAVARFKVKNTGARAGDEVVQLYIHDELASVARPVTEMKGFQRIHLRPGEQREVSFAVTPQHLTMLNRLLQPVIEPGTFRIRIGASSKDIRLQSDLTVRP